MCRDGAGCGFYPWSYARLDLELRTGGGGGGVAVVIIALAFALVSEELACPYAQEALGAGVGTDGEGGTGRGKRRALRGWSYQRRRWGAPAAVDGLATLGARSGLADGPVTMWRRPDTFSGECFRGSVLQCTAV